MQMTDIALVPAILGGFTKQAQSHAAGVEGLGGLLGQLGGGSLLDQVLAPQPTNVSLGNEVLGRVFGSKDVSRAVAQNAASQSGLDPSLLKKDASDARDACRRLHGETAQAPGSAEATALIRSTTSCEWPAERCVSRLKNRYLANSGDSDTSARTRLIGAGLVR
jgi:Bacterial protein of unknown function (DUF937)